MTIMSTPTRKPAQTSKSWLQKIYGPLGFTKTYNFVLWFIFAGALLGFSLARFMYLNFRQNFCPYGGTSGSNGAAPGECYYYLNFDRYKIGIILHLAGILPAGILAVIQFTPFIRYRWIIVHRISGYAALLLYIVSLVGALMIARHAFGGGLEVQVWIGFVGIGILVCFIISYINIKRLQIEQHRAWMLRGWFYVRSLTSLTILVLLTQYRLVRSSLPASS
jgi:NADH:ubiquinone oxidoreductase subunit 6 (subunit J)